MAARLAFFFASFLVVLYLIQAAEIGAKPEKSASETIDDTFSKIKAGFDEIVEKVQGNEYVQNATRVLEEFGKSVQNKGKEIISKLKNDEPQH